MRSRYLLAAFFFLAGIGTAPHVNGAQPSENPEVLIRIGNDLRRKGDDRRAEGYLQRAYDLARTPRSAAQLGLLELALGRALLAEGHLSEALASDDAWVQDHKEVLTTSRTKARAKLLGVELVGAPRDATVVSADGTITKVPADGVLWLEPGEVKLTVQAIGRKPTALALSGVAGEKRRIEVAMPSLEPVAAPVAVPEPAPPSGEPVATPAPVTASAPAPAPDAPSDTGRSKRIAGLVIGGAGVALAVTGVLVLARGNSKIDATNTAGTGIKGGTYDPANGNYQTFQGLGVGLIVGGAAAVVGGGILYYFGRESAEPPAVSLNVSSGRGLLQWAGAF